VPLLEVPALEQRITEEGGDREVDREEGTGRDGTDPAASGPISRAMKSRPTREKAAEPSVSAATQAGEPVAGSFRRINPIIGWPLRLPAWAKPGHYCSTAPCLAPSIPSMFHAH
jgi:hypothetical protein